MPEQRAFTRTAKTGDSIRVRATMDRGTVLAFTAQLEISIDGQFRPAERYDSAHGRPHRDTLDWSGRVIAKVWLPATMSLNEALTLAEHDLGEHAATYRAAFLRRRTIS